MIREAIAAVVAGKDLSERDAAATMEEIMSGEATPSQIGALLVGLRMKGESVDEIAGMARVMREKALRVEVEGDLLDTCSTGGGSFDPLNISTAAALVCAGAGVRVAKHGNRGFTSAAGAADVLEALGAKIDLGPEQVKACIERAGFGFLFAQAFHPAMRHAGPTRREIGIRTVFNSLGPLTNPPATSCSASARRPWRRRSPRCWRGWARAAPSSSTARTASTRCRWARRPRCMTWRATLCAPTASRRRRLVWGACPSKP